MKPLFVYGTLRSAAWRETLLGAAYPARPATLRDYCRIANASGYLSLRAMPPGVSSVAGALIELDELGWQIADAWEDVAVTFPQNDGGDPDDIRSNAANDSTELTSAPADVTLYARVDVTIDTADGPVSATAYVCPDPEGAPVDDDARLALRSDAEVEAAISAFVPRMRALREAR